MMLHKPIDYQCNNVTCYTNIKKIKILKMKKNNLKT